MTLSLIWGTSFILIKKGLQVFSPGEVGSIRVAAAALFLLPFALVRLKELDRSHYVKLLASGLLGVFFPAFLFAIAQTRLTSSVAGVMNSLTPIFTLIIGASFFGQRFSMRSLIGILIGLCGTILLILSRANGEFGPINFYAFFVILACVFYGTNLNLIKYKIAGLKSLTITSVSLMLIAPFALIYLFGFSDFTQKLQSHDGAWEALGFVVLLGMMSTSVATFLFNQLVKISTPLFASSVTYLIPVVAVAWGLLDNETLFPGHIAGMAAIVGGVYLANKR